MKKAYYIGTALGISCSLFTLWMYTMPHLLAILLAAATFMGLVVSLLASGILGWARWRRTSRLWMVPALICLASIVIAWFTPAVGRLLADEIFKRRLAEYTEVIEEIQNDKKTIAANGNLIAVDPRNPPHDVRAVRALRCHDGALIAEFLLDTKVPLVHDGYVYKGYEENNACMSLTVRPEKRWPYVRHVSGNWYHFSDQPGL